MKSLSPHNKVELYVQKIQKSQRRIESLISNSRINSSQKLTPKPKEVDISYLKDYINKRITKRYTEFTKIITSLSPNERSHRSDKIRLKRINSHTKDSVPQPYTKNQDSPGRLYLKQHSESRIPRISKPQDSNKMNLMPTPESVSFKKPISFKRIRLFK